MSKIFPLRVLYSIPGKLYLDEGDLIKILEKCKFKESSGRFFGILEFDIKSLVKKLSRFSIPGFIIKCSVNNSEGRIYVSVNGEDVDVLPIIYLDSNATIRGEVFIEVISIIVSNDLLIMLEFNAE
ncbi:MAG: hypothetical protein GXO26_08915 [Crenarchaeota archaeon]|nr:hypothetical protein [Thermoproteota archaeon]